MERRAVTSALLSLLPLAVAAQPARRIDVLAPSTAARESVTLKPFVGPVTQFGWIEDATVRYHRGYADDRYHELPRLARELVVRRPELILAPPAPAPAAVAAKA